MLFARSDNLELYEFKPGSITPDLTVTLTTFGYPNDGYGTLQFVPPGLPGAGLLKVPDFFTGEWYDVALSANGSGTYNVTGVTGPNATASIHTMGVLYVPPGSPQFTSPSVLVDQYYTGPIWVYALDTNGNPTGSGTPFITSLCPYGATIDPLTGDMFFTTTLSGEDLWQVQGFSPGTLSVTTGNPQSAMVDRSFARPLKVTLKDPYGSPVSGVTINFAAPSSGATATLASNSAVTGSDGTASVTAKANGTPGSYIVTATLYGFTANFSLANVALSALTLSPAAVVGGKSATANTVTLTSAAPAAGATIKLTSSHPGVAAVPASVIVAGGSSVSPEFIITTTAVAGTDRVTIEASDGLNVKAEKLTVLASTPSKVRLSPAAVIGGKSTTNNTVTLDGPAPAGGAVVNLMSSDPTVAAVPASVTVAAGATTSPVFTITTTAVPTQTPETISATYNGVTKNATLTVNAPQIATLTLSRATVVGGKTTTENTVVLNGPAPAGGAVVMLTSGNSVVAAPQATVTVAAGAKFATFTITTTAVTSSTVVPITASYGGASIMANLTVAP